MLQYFLGSWYSGENGVSYLSSGIAYSSANGGALRNNANAAFVALLYRLEDHGSNSRKYACWARQQLELLTGSGTSQGYVVGFGTNPPLLASHRGASCAASVANCVGSTTDSAAYLSASANPHVLNGALVAGPGSGSYTDVRTSTDNSVSIEYNSAFMGAVAILASESGNVCWKREGIVGQAGHPIGDE